MNYHYRAYTTDKQVVEGTISATSDDNAEESLYQSGFNYILSLSASPPRLTVDQVLPTLFGVKRQDIIDFSRQLAAFLASGISLLTALELLESQVTRPAMRTIITGLAEDIQGGSSFSKALSRYPELFPDSYYQIVKASEQGGELETGLKQISNHLEREMVVASRIRRALTYPAFVTLIAVAVFILLITVVLPPMVVLFTSFKTSLPWATRTIIGFTDFFTHYKFQVMLAFVAVAIGLFGYSRLPTGKTALDRLLLRLPVFGSIAVQSTMGQFCRTAGMLVTSGLQLPQVMETATQTVSGNQVIKRALTEVREKLVQGEGLSHSMSQNSLFPSMMVKMIAIGEQTGAVDTALVTLADYYETQTNQRVQTIISMMEPTIIVVIGIGVAFLLISIITPLYSILGSIR